MTAIFRDPNAPGAEAGLAVAGNVARIHGNKDNYVMTSEQGTTISGPVSFVAGASQIRFGGMWTMNNELMLQLPSTLATPIPTMMINPPIKQIVSLAKDAIIFMGLIGAFAAVS
jgi:hypothetical protein